MSGGEKARLVLALIVYQQPNLLLLDEPTNHLDLEMRHALNIALQGFTGAMVLVSHDRFLLSAVCEDFYLVDAGQVGPFDGDLGDYREWILKQQTGAAEASPGETDSSAQKPDRKEQKRREAEFRRRVSPIRKALEKHEKSMEKLSVQLKDVEAQLADSTVYDEQNKAALMSLLEEQKTLTIGLEEAESAWLEEQEALESAREEFDEQA